MPSVSIIDKKTVLSEYPMKAIVNVSDIQKEFEIRKQLMDNQPHFLIVRLHGLSVFEDKAAELLSQKDFVELTRAVAIVLKEDGGYVEIGKLLLERFIWTKKLETPVKLFTNSQQAMTRFSSL